LVFGNLSFELISCAFICIELVLFFVHFIYLLFFVIEIGMASGICKQFER